MSYANGPGYYNTYFNNGTAGRFDPSEQDLEDPEFQFHATVPLDVETHGGTCLSINLNYFFLLNLHDKNYIKALYDFYILGLKL